MPEFQEKHYSNTTSFNTPQLIEIKIIQALKPDRFNDKYFANVNTINGLAGQGKILINLSKDSKINPLSPDEALLVYSSILKIPEPLNPHQFNYAEYMKLLGVYGQLRISRNNIIKINTGSSTIFGTAQNLRSEIVLKLQKTKLKTDERAIIQALILGEKKDIDKKLYNEYASAGAVHILAVSGLHVGILYFILAFLLKPFSRIKYGLYLDAIIIVLFLWAFAVISGLSPSVTRAVTMFSFFAVANLLNRRTSAINTLFLSLLILLIINPLWLFQVGFQLSYLAVFFIVWLQPIFYKIGYSKYWILRKIWGIASVTICAQIGVLPLSLYYFHQFPGLFLVTNIVILPFLTILMCGGLLIVSLAILNHLPNWLAEIYNTMLEGLNGFIHWIAMQDAFLFKEIYLSTFKVLGAYLLIIAWVLFMKKTNYRRLVISLLSVSLFIIIFIYDDFKTSHNHFVVFHISGKTVLAHKIGKKMILYKNDSTLNPADIYPIKPYKTAMNIQEYSVEKLPRIFSYSEKNILVLDSLGIFPKQRDIHTVILIESPKINLVRLIDSLNPKQIIADGSNYYSYTKRWKKTCELKKLPFYHTARQGAFPIE